MGKNPLVEEHDIAVVLTDLRMPGIGDVSTLFMPLVKRR